MIRTILRNVQNSLMLSSVLLVVLALQRLQTFDVTHHHHPTNHSPSYFRENHHETQSFENENYDIIEQPLLRVGAHHQLRLGQEYRIGLFRFFLPRLERREPHSSAALQQEQEQQQGNTMAATIQSNTRPSSWQVVPETSSVAFVVDLQSHYETEQNKNPTRMTCEQLVNAATVLRLSILTRQSLLRMKRTKSGNTKRQKDTMHALVPASSDVNDECSSTAALADLGFELVHHVDRSHCGGEANNVTTLNSDSPGWQHFAMTINHADMVVNVPIESMLIPPEIQRPSSPSRRYRHRRQLSVSNTNPDSDATQVVSVLLPRRSSACNATLSSCSNTTQPSRDGLEPCRVSRSMSIVTFHPEACPLPTIDCNEKDDEEDDNKKLVKQLGKACVSWQGRWKRLYRTAKNGYDNGTRAKC